MVPFRSLPILLVTLATLRAQQLPNACPLPDATAGAPYSHQMRATGFTTAPRWLPSGLPEGLSQNADSGLITGTPVRAGNHLVTIFASAFQENQLAVAICTMAVNVAAPVDPAVTGLRIVTSALPQAAALTPYSAALEGDGGRSPYTWSAVAGSALPNGLSLSSDGRVAGRASLPGDYAFRVRLADAGGQQFETPVALSVAAPPPFDLSSSAVAFTAVADGAEPTPVTVNVVSTVPHPFQAEAVTDAGWLSVSPAEGEAPAALTLRANPAGLSPGRYEGQLNVRSRAGDTLRTIAVTLEIANPATPPKLSLDTTELNFAINPASPTATRTVRVLNLGGGSLSYTAEVRALVSDNWLTVTPASGTATATEPATLTVDIDASVLPPNTDQVTGRIDVTSPDGQTRTIGVLLSTVRDEVPVIASPSRIYLPLFTGAPALPQSFSLRNDGRDPQEFAVVDSLPNVVFSPARGSIAPGSVADVQVSVRDTVTTPPGPLSANAAVTFGTGKEPLRIVLGSEVTALTSGAPLLLSANAVTILPAPNAPGGVLDLRLQNPSNAAITLQITPASTGGWLSVDSRRATLEPGAILRLRLTAAGAGLNAGTYRGTVTLQPQSGAARIVNVLFFPRGTCQPTDSVVQMRSLAGNPLVNASFPIALEAGVYDNCGNPLRTGTVTVTFSNGDPAVSLTSLLDGRWAGEWVIGRVPADRRIAWSLSVNAGQLRGVENGSLQLGSGNLPPAVTSLLDPVSGIEERPIAPGAVFRVLGARLANGTAQAAADSWPSTLSGAEVLLDGRPLPIFQTTADSVIAQAPFDLRANQRVSISVRRQGLTSIPLRVETRIAAPGIRTVDPSGTGLGLFADLDGKPITTANPAKPGMTLTMLCGGLGKVDDASVVAGTVPASLARLSNAVFVRVGGVDARVTVAGLTANNVGLYRVNFVVPDLAPDTADVPVLVIVGGQLSQTVTLPVAR